MGKEKITIETIDKLLSLSCLELTKSEKESFVDEITSIIEMLDINTESILKTMRNQLSEALSMGEIEDYEMKKSALDKLKERRKSLVDLYLDNCISKAEFKDKAASMDMEIQRKEEELGESCKYTFEKQEMTRVINECIEYAKDWMNASEITENFIKEILEEMVIY